MDRTRPSGHGASTNPTQCFSNFFNAYAKAINKAYNRTGGLFQERFGRIPVTGDAYFTSIVRYIHYNPQKHGIVTDFTNYPYSSYQTLLNARPTRLQREAVIDWFGGRASFAEFHAQRPEDKRIKRFIGDDAD